MSQNPTEEMVSARATHQSLETPPLDGVSNGRYVLPGELLSFPTHETAVDAPIGQLIQTAQAGQPEAADALFAALYRELHAIAERELRRNSHDVTLGTTSLVHEAYLNVVQREGVGFATRAQFLSYAARAMRGLTIDYVRRRQAKKRGGELYITSSGLDHAAMPESESAEQLEQLGSALDTLAGVDPALAELVDLHFFCGFSFAELAELRGVSERTVQRDWRKARLLLRHSLQEV